MSQFIEMFGTVESTKPLTDFIDVSFPGEWGQEDKDGSGVKVIRTTNFTNNGKLDLSDVVTRDIDYAKVEKKKLSKGDIILERSGGTNDNPVGRVVYFEEDGVYLFNNFTQLLRCKEGVNSLFLFYSLFNYYQMNKNVIRSMGNKTTGIQNLKMDRYWQIPIADVSIERQKEFESIYRQADKSGFDGHKSQFIEMFGSVDDNLKSYDIKIVGDFAECFAGATPSTKIPSYWDNGNIPWMSSGEVHKGRVQDTDAKITQQGYDGCSTKMVPIHSIVVALAGQGKTRGTVAINEIELCTNQSLCAIVPNGEVNYEYLFHNLRGRYKELRSMSGDVDGRGGLNLKHIQSIKVIVPPMSEQMKFVSIARQADKSGSVLQYRIAC